MLLNEVYCASIRQPFNFNIFKTIHVKIKNHNLQFTDQLHLSPNQHGTVLSPSFTHRRCMQYLSLSVVVYADAHAL